jgi:DNA invertase Pin-like site-specific DNA recombinase
MGRHYDIARALDAHRAWRAGGVRARPNPGAHRRRPSAGRGARVKLGRKPKWTEHQKREAIRRRDIDGEPVREIARSYNVSHSTISRPTTINDRAYAHHRPIYRTYL